MKKVYIVVVRIICFSALLFSITNVHAQITHAYSVSSGLGSHPAKILYENNSVTLGGYSSFGNDSTYINLMHINSGFTVGTPQELSSPADNIGDLGSNLTVSDLAFISFQKDPAGGGAVK